MFEFLNNLVADKEIEQLKKTNVYVKPDCKSINGFVISFEQFLRLPENDCLSRICDNLRQMIGWKGNEEIFKNKTKGEWYKEIKSRLPQCIMTSDSPKSHSIVNPYIIVDIDNVEVNEENFNKLLQIPYVLLVGISPSYKGFYCVVKFNSGKFNNEQLFKAMFKKLEIDFKEYYGFEIDSQCSNVNRARNLSPFEYRWSNSFKEPFDTTIDLKCKIRENIMNEKYEVTKIDSFIPENFIYRGKEGENYYRILVIAGVPIKIDNMYAGEEGQNYHLLYSYSNTIYEALGDDGFEIFKSFFPTTDLGTLNSYWNSSRSRIEISCKNKIMNELETLGFIKRKD